MLWKDLLEPLNHPTKKKQMKTPHDFAATQRDNWTKSSLVLQKSREEKKNVMI